MGSLSYLASLEQQTYVKARMKRANVITAIVRASAPQASRKCANHVKIAGLHPMVAGIPLFTFVKRYLTIVMF